MVKLRSIVSYSWEKRERWRQGPTCFRWSKLRRIGGLGGLTMAPRKSSGCGACIPELTTRRHCGRLLCLGSRAKASTLRGRHRRFAGGSVFHTSSRGLLSLLATQQKWFHHLQQQVVHSLIPHSYYIHQVQYNVYAGVPSKLLFVVVVVFFTLTDPLRIQPWSQDRRNQTKSNRESEISRESRHKRTDKKVASKDIVAIKQKTQTTTLYVGGLIRVA